MVDIEIVREWIEKAEEDFQFALANLQERNSFFAQICFHFQQSAEKYQKEGILAIALILSNDSVHSLWGVGPTLRPVSPTGWKLLLCLPPFLYSSGVNQGVIYPKQP
jgi:hypothetical protein